MEAKLQSKRGINLSLRGKLTLAIVSVLLFSVTLNTVLSFLNFEKRLTTTSDSIYQVVLQETYSDISQALSFGLPLASITNIQSLIERRSTLVSGIKAIEVIDINGNALFAIGEQTHEAERVLSKPIVNTFNIVVGELKLHYATSQLSILTDTLFQHQLSYAVFWIFATGLIGYVTLRYLLNSFSSVIVHGQHILDNHNIAKEDKLLATQKLILHANKGKRWQSAKTKSFPLLVICLAITLTIFANIGSSYQSMQLFSSVYQQQLEQKSSLIGHTLTTMVERLLGHGIPLNKLNGLEQEFAQYIEHHPELIAITLQQNHQTLYHFPEHISPVNQGVNNTLKSTSNTQIELNVATDDNLIIQLMKDSAMDMLTVLVASCLVVAEIILFFCNYMIRMPWHHIKQMLVNANRDMVSHVSNIRSTDEIGRLIASLRLLIVSFHPTQKKHVLDSQDYHFIRLPMFILVFAEAASLAFFPNYVASLPTNQTWLPESLITSLPISLFMLCWAISLPFAGYWSDKVGRRRSLITGGIITSLGLLATSLSSNLEFLLVTRAVTAIGYGIVFISAQGYVSDTTSDHNRTKGMATFLSAFFSGSLCGAAIGGILADKLGYATTFALASILGFISVLLVASFFEKGQTNQQSRPVQLRDFKLLFSNKYFALITLFSAIPAKVVLTGFLYYICPVYLQYLGESSAVSGRVMMGYGLAIIVISPLSAILIDKWDRKISFIVLGGMISAIALLNIILLPGTVGLLAIVIMIGIAHGICISPQVPLLVDLLANQDIDKGKIIGIFRLTERLGNIAGPMLAGLALSLFQYEKTIMMFGIALLVSSLTLTAFYLLFTRRDREQLEAIK